MDLQVPVGPPRLVDFSCQVCSKAPATDPGNTTTSCLLQFKVQDNGSTVNEHSTITAELTGPALDTLLDGMRRIRDQLSNVAGRK